MTEPLALTDQERVEHAARVFSDLLREHKLAGFFAISAETHGTHALEFGHAPWLRLSVEEDGEGHFIGFRVRSKLDDYLARGLSEDAARMQQQREIEYTMNALDHIASTGSPMCIVMLQMLGNLRQRFGAETTSKRVGDATGKLQ